MKNIFTTVVTILLLSPLTTLAALNTSESQTIDTFIARWSTNYSSTEVDRRATHIIDRIEYTLEVSQVNEFTYDILTYIAQALEGYLLEDQQPINIVPVIVTNQSTPQTSTPTPSPSIDTSIADAIEHFENNTEVTILAGTQSKIVAEIDLTARLEPFELESLKIQATDSDIQSFVAQGHLYTENGILLDSDSPDSTGVFDFNFVNNYRLEQGTTRVYLVLDTRVVGYNGTSDDDLSAFTLRIIEGQANGVFSSTNYSIPQKTISTSITIQSVLITDIRFVESSQGARVSTRLTNGSNTIAILELQTAESNNNESNSPRDLDVILDSLQLQINDSTLANSAKESVILERLDRSGKKISGTMVGGDTVRFDFDTADMSALIENGDTAVFRLVAEDIRLDSSTGSVKVEIDQVRDAVGYRSSNDISSLFTKNTTENSLVSANQISSR